MNEPILKGVNLGGWLVLEKWITPTLFEGTDAEDEFTFMQTPGASVKLARHRDTWITKSDFAWLAAHGVNAVRLPIGYWSLSGAEPFAACARYIDKAFEWADTYGIKVLLDVHALPESQNGHDHSGRIGKANWQHDRAARRRSLDILDEIATRYADRPALWGLQIINEPNAGVLQLALRSYYANAYYRLAKRLPPHVKIVYADAWSPRIFAFALPFLHRAVMDVHLYHMATLRATSHSLDWYYRLMRRKLRTLGFLSRIRPMIIGEWSGVISGETLKGLPADEAAAREREHLTFQREQYARFSGTFYWTYKTEGTDLNYWNFRSIVETETVQSTSNA